MDAKTVQWIVDQALAEQQKKFTEQLKEMNAFQRKLKIEQMKASYKSPADKRAVGYLADEDFDWKDFSEALQAITENGELLDVGTHAQEFAKFGEFCFRFATMRSRKNLKESEAYKVANESRYGWMTEKFYRQGEIFQKETDDVWFENDDLTTEEKLDSFRQAEKCAKLALEKKSEFGAENSPDVQFVQCYGCGAFGHTQRYCPS